MDPFAYSRCAECDEEKFFSDGSRCARCLGVSPEPVEDEECEGNTEVSGQISLDRLAAA